MNTRRLTGTLLTLALTGSMLTACGGDGNDTGTGTSAVCDDVDALRTSMGALKTVDLRAGDKISDLTDALDQIKTDVGKLVDDASAKYQTEIDAVQSGADRLGTSVDAAVADPHAASLSTVADDVRGLGTAFKDLQKAVADTC
jgi:hypothetical protein